MHIYLFIYNANLLGTGLSMLGFKMGSFQFHNGKLPILKLPPKGAKVYPASRRRSNKRVGLKGQLAPHCVPWLKNYIMAYKRLSTSLGSKTLNNTSFLGLGGNQNLRPSCRRPPARTFHTPVGTLRLDAPALVWVRSPNDGNKLRWS